MRIFGRDYMTGLLVMAIILTVIGSLVVYSASNPLKTHQGHIMNFLKSHAFKELMFLLAGIAISMLVFLLGRQFFAFISWFLYPVNVGMLALVLAIGVIRLGAQRWLQIGRFSIQPSEFSKIIIILALAKYMDWDFDNRKSLRFLIISFIIAGIPMALIMKQPDLGTSMILMPILYSMLFFAGANYFYLFGTIVMGIAAAPFFWMKLAQYQKDRLLTFINPSADPTGTGYTILQSKVAVGSGEIWGKGWFHGTQTQLGFLPERHTDFIFSVLGEEWGFAGAVVVIICYFIFFYFGLNIAYQCKNIFAKTAAMGLVVMTFSHVFINMAMTIGLMPVTGVPLPFISYGGSSLLTAFVAIGLLQSFYSTRDSL
jgi:rod shape determining protein RodA